MIDNIIEPLEDEGAKQVKIENIIKDTKEEKNNSIETLTVSVNGIEYNGDNISQNRMTSVLSLANWQFNKNISVVLNTVADQEDTDDVTKAMLTGLATIFDNLYNQIYKVNKVGWKCADGLHNVQIDSVANALYKSMLEVGSIISTTEQKIENEIQSIINERVSNG